MTMVRKIEVPINQYPINEPWTIRHIFTFEFFRIHIMGYLGDRSFYSKPLKVTSLISSL